nr:DUF4961 domain-containing protein [uncultured Carboxylicivirga sp.]
MKSRKIFRKFIRPSWLTYIFFSVVLACCINLDSIDYEPTVIAGEEAVFILNCRIEPNQDSDEGGERLMMGFLVPKSWNAAENTTVTYTSSIDEITKTMSLIPDDVQPKNMQGRTWPEALKEKWGVGTNVIDDMEWIAYQTDDIYNVRNGEKIPVTITVKTIAGSENLKFKPNFMINNSGDGLSKEENRWDIIELDCFEVIEGEGAVIDYCELHINNAQPIYCTKDDIVTIRYQGDILENVLDDYDEIYLCATAVTDNGNTYEFCDVSDKTKMRREHEFGRTFSLTFWPAGYFDIPDGESIVKILYSFKNEDGSVELQEVLEDETEVPFEYIFMCK